MIGIKTILRCGNARIKFSSTPCGVFLHCVQNRVIGFSLACVIRVAQLTGLNRPASPLQHDTSGIGAAAHTRLFALA